MEWSTQSKKNEAERSSMDGCMDYDDGEEQAIVSRVWFFAAVASASSSLTQNSN